MSKRKSRKIRLKKAKARLAYPKIKNVVDPDDREEALEEPTRLMWAYGSNLCLEQMKSRCPAAKPFAPLCLKNGQLTFRGVADCEFVESEEGKPVSVIQGGLWKITRKCEAALDTFEGVRGGVYEKRYLLLSISGKLTKCLYYKMLPQDEGEFGVMPPRQSYFDTIVQGYRDFGLDLRYLEEAVERAWDDKTISEDVYQRWVSWGKPRLVRKESAA
jgi:hypothetical protein